jgi:hypothetical protein
VLEWVPTIVVVVLLTGGIWLWTLRGEETAWQPVRLLGLSVEPNTVEIGGPVTLHNGVCNDTDLPLNVSFWLGAQRIADDPLLARTIDIIGGPTPETMERVTLEPGPCQNTEPIESTVPATFTPGEWRLVVIIVVQGSEGQIQRLTEQSPPFTVTGSER